MFKGNINELNVKNQKTIIILQGKSTYNTRN